jgi:tRNA(adenine34) deaminase
MTDEQYMELAVSQAKIAIEKGNWPIGCVIVLDGEVIAEAHNLVYSAEDRVAHAELIALKAAQPFIFKKPGEAILYTTFEPCPMCFGACLNSRLKRVVYGVDLNDSGAVHFKDYLPDLYRQNAYNTEFIGGTLAGKCEEVYRQGEAAVLRIRQGLADQSHNK